MVRAAWHEQAGEGARTPGDPKPVPPRTHAVLYDREGTDRVVPVEGIEAPAADDALLWVDVEGHDAAAVETVFDRLGIPDHVREAFVDLHGAPRLGNFGAHVLVQVVTARHAGDARFNGIGLSLLAGPGFVISMHPRPITFIDTLREREQGETRLGILQPGLFLASLLDWQLDTYFEAIGEFERLVERLEEGILRNRLDENSVELSSLRRAASRLRRMLAPHRELYASLARPDFRPEEDAETTRAFERIDAHFERAMDAVESARDTVIGSLELFSNQIALRTNRSMRILTFATVVIGCLSVVAGVLGMNFPARFFDAGDRGFWIALGAMGSLALAATAVGWWRKWF